MTPERWRQVLDVFDAALQAAEGERGAFVESVCVDDDDLARAVHSLLLAHQSASGFASAPIMSAKVTLSDEGLPMIDQMYGHYRIEALVGTGGMGRVYRAWDTKLHRIVAIKILRSTLGQASRLMKEARAAAALNHPHICTIHEVGEAEDLAFIVMEYLEGQSLSEIIPAQGLPIGIVTRYGAQIAEALAHAHERGIVHCDLKSANVMVVAVGRIKVLDFGLARRELSPNQATESNMSLGEMGGVAGTLAYMPPDVLRGKPADAGSDLWGLGVVLYEMACGRRPFVGQTSFELAAAILENPPHPFPSEVPAPLREVIERSLQKESKERFQRANDVRVVLEGIASVAEPRVDIELERLFSLSPDLICIAGFDGFFKRLNPAWSKTLGWSTEELLSRPWLDFVHPDDRAATVKASMTVAAVMKLENRYRCRNGSYRWLEWTANAAIDEETVYGVARDVTERRRMEE